MAKTSIAIPDELLEKAKIEAVKRKISFAELVREQLERYFRDMEESRAVLRGTRGV